MNIPFLINEVEIWESKSKYPPNRNKWRRALVSLGAGNNWKNVDPLTYDEALKIRDSKKIDGRDYPRWDKICKGIKQITEKGINRPQHKAAGSMERPDYIDVENVNHKQKPVAPETHITFTPEDIDALEDGKTKFVTHGGITIDLSVFGGYVKNGAISSRTQSTYERENKNLRKTIEKKDRELNRLMDDNKDRRCPNCVAVRSQAIETAHIQANALADKDVKINMLQKKVNDLVHSFQDVKSQASVNAKTQGTIKKLETMLALTRKRAEQAEMLSNRYATEIDELTAKLELGGDSVEVDSLKKENEILWGKLRKAEQKLADNTIDWDTAITGLMQGRVLEPEIGAVSLTDKDRHDLKRFAEIWDVTLDTLPDIYVYGMKHKESAMCKRHNIKIDDYGQPETNTLSDMDLARALSYLDGAVAHAHQEIQAAVRMARILTGSKQ